VSIADKKANMRPMRVTERTPGTPAENPIRRGEHRSLNSSALNKVKHT